MLVTKALSHDVASLAFDPFCSVQGLQHALFPAGFAAFHFKQLEGLGKKNPIYIKKQELLFKKRIDLSTLECKYYPLFGQRTVQSIVDKTLNYDPVLKSQL